MHYMNFHRIAGQKCITNTPEKTAIMRFFLDRAWQRHSLETITRETGLTAAAAVEGILELNTEGARIGHPEPHVYYFEPVENRLHPDGIAAHLATRWWGRRIWIGEEITSTLEIADALSLQVKHHGTVIAADFQTQGRGRFGSAWVSHKGKDILLTFLIENPPWEPSASLLSLYAATAVARVLDTVYRLPIAVKWPNDLSVDGKKLGGVLVQWDDRHKRLLVSLGLNVHSSPLDWPGEWRNHTVSLSMLKKEDWQREVLIAQCGTTWETLWESMMQDRGETVKGYWIQYSATLGKTVSLTARGKNVLGTARTLDDSGRLVIAGEDGTEYALLPEEVQKLKVLE